MLPRQRPSNHPRHGSLRQCRCARPALCQWLRAPGSLTARLRQLGPVEVLVQHQGTQRLWPAERLALGARSGHVREVLLLLHGQPVVWARSATTHRALRGPWKALKGLGSRPLAELLFSHASVLRGPLMRHDWLPGGAEHLRARQDWQRLLSQTKTPAALGQPNDWAGWAPPRRGRASVFRHHGQPLRVMEAFSPRLAGYRTY
jgi:chorismate lyase